MLRSLIFKIINKFAGQYFIGFNKEHFNFVLAEGKIRLDNVILNPEAINKELSQISIPFAIKAGVIGKLRVQIGSFIELGRLTVQVDELYLVFGVDQNYFKTKDVSQLSISPRRCTATRRRSSRCSVRSSSRPSTSSATSRSRFSAPPSSQNSSPRRYE